MEKGPGLGKNLLEKASKKAKQWALFAAVVSSPAFLESCGDEAKLKAEEISGKNYKEFLANNPEAPQLQDATALQVRFLDGVSDYISPEDSLVSSNAVINNEGIEWKGEQAQLFFNNGDLKAENRLAHERSFHSNVGLQVSQYIDGSPAGILGVMEFQVIKVDESTSAPIVSFKTVTPHAAGTISYEYMVHEEQSGEWKAKKMEEPAKAACESFEQIMSMNVDDAFRNLDVRYDSERRLFYYGPEDKRKAIDALQVMGSIDSDQDIEQFVKTLEIEEGKK